MQLILSVLSNDKPGVVRAIASVVTLNGGNWLDCRLSRLAGKFTGVICISLDPLRKEPLIAALQQLAADGVRVLVDEAAPMMPLEMQRVIFNAAGPDRPGLVLEISQALSERGVNVVELATECTSMPYSGDPLFTAEGMLELPAGLSGLEIGSLLNLVASELGIDIVLNSLAQEVN